VSPGNLPTPAGATRGPRPRAAILRLALAGLLGVTAALLVACGGSSAKLIPVADAGPLQSDFETIAQDAEAGNGSCTMTEAAILKAQQDFSTLPASVDSGLRQTLRQGIENLRARALVLCAQPLAQTTSTNTTSKTTTTNTVTTPTTTTNTTTQTTTTPPSTTPSTPTSTTPGGGTPAPGEGETPGTGGAPGGGTGAGPSSPQGESGASGNPTEAGGGIGANGQEATK
jgi:hypothetical protein